jgi:hypothetical protein
MIKDLSKAQQDLLRDILQRHGSQLLILLDSPDAIKLTGNQRDELRQLITDELCATGLRDDYEPNQRGLLLEELIDRVGHL